MSSRGHSGRQLAEFQSKTGLSLVELLTAGEFTLGWAATEVVSKKTIGSFDDANRHITVLKMPVLEQIAERNSADLSFLSLTARKNNGLSLFEYVYEETLKGKTIASFIDNPEDRTPFKLVFLEKAISNTAVNLTGVHRNSKLHLKKPYKNSHLSIVKH